MWRPHVGSPCMWGPYVGSPCMWGPHVGLIILENGVRKDISHGRIEQEANWWLFWTRLRPNLAQYYATGSKTLVLAVRMSLPNGDCWIQKIVKIASNGSRSFAQGSKIALEMRL